MSLASAREWLTKDYDLYKTVIVAVGGLGLLLLALFGVQWSTHRSYLAALASGEADLKKIYQNARAIAEINELKKGDIFLGGGQGIDRKLRELAFKLYMGDIDIRTSTDKAANVESTHYTITQAEKDRFVTREQLVQLLYQIESGTSRARVTGISLNPPSRGFRSGERREDQWTFSAKVTSRRQVEQRSP